MTQYHYSPLSSQHDSIRLLRLMPHEDETADIQCELFEYSLRDSHTQFHLYEALSYVWGDPKKKLPLIIHNHRLDVTVNLHAALLRLRNHSLERVLWIDALCIDQANQEEKELQIRYMAKIYGKANCVLVWLGEAADNSDLALEQIRIAGSRGPVDYSSEARVQKAVLALLQRQWFRRIWVWEQMLNYCYIYLLRIIQILQEVAAARRIQIMCGFNKMDGYVFCLGVLSFKHCYETMANLQGMVRAITYLIKEAPFRPDFPASSSHRSSLDICPLGELVDMYHTHESSKRHDRVYALLGMSSDDLGKAGLSPDYSLTWEKLFQRVIRYLFPEDISLEFWGDAELAVIRSSGHILGKMDLALSYAKQPHKDDDGFILKNINGQVRWDLQPSAEPVRPGDLACLLRGSSRPMIIRPSHVYLKIIQIAARPPENIPTEEGNVTWSKFLQLSLPLTRDLLLLWSWDNSPEAFQHPNEYKAIRETEDLVTKQLKELGGCLYMADRIWDVALALGDAQERDKAREQLKEAIKGYREVFHLEHQDNLNSYAVTPLMWAAGNGHEAVTKQLLGSSAAWAHPDLKESEFGQTPLSWAAEGGHHGVVKLLLDTGKVTIDSRDNYNRTPLSWAAKGGHYGVVKLLLDTGEVEIDSRDIFNWTPFSRAAEGGHDTVVQLLLDTGNVDINYGDKDDRTPLSWAAKGGSDTMVKLLLKTPKIEVNCKDRSGDTPLIVAAKKGYRDIVELLLKTPTIEVNCKDNIGHTPLTVATREGHQDVVKLLLKTPKIEVNCKDIWGDTPLTIAAREGHQDIVKLLLATGKAKGRPTGYIR